MIIDSLTDKRSINIDKLTIPDVKNESYPTFDPKEDLTKKDFEHGFEDLDRLREAILAVENRYDWGTSANSIHPFILLAEPLKFFAPEQKSRLGLDHNLFAQVNEYGRQFLAIETRLKFAAALKCLFPEFSTELFTADRGSFKKAVEARLYGLRNEKMWAVFADKVKDTKQLFRDEVEMPPLNENDWEAVAREIVGFRLVPGFALFDSVLRIASSMKLVYPESKELLGLDKGTWRWMRGKLQAGRGKVPWGTFFDLAYRLTILAADEAKITPDGGIEVVKSKPKHGREEKIPEMPVKRIF